MMQQTDMVTEVMKLMLFFPLRFGLILKKDLKIKKTLDIGSNN